VRIVYFGITQFAVKGLKKLIQLNASPVALITIPAQTQDTDIMNAICKEQNIPVYSFDNINNPQFISILKNELQPDLIIVYTFHQKLSKEIYEVAKYAINMHPSFLPSYKGNNPYFWPIANGEAETGVTFHHINDNFDSGDIISQQKVSIAPEDTCGMVISKLEASSTYLLELIINMLNSGEDLPRIPQVLGQYPLAPKPQLKDYFIDWHWNNKKIVDRVRALNPYTGAYAQFRNSVLAIYQVQASGYSSIGKPGAIVAFSPDGPLVKTGDGAILLKTLAVGKKYLLSGNDFMEYEKVKIGDILTPWE